jgi:hypothetical protein
MVGIVDAYPALTRRNLLVLDIVVFGMAASGLDFSPHPPAEPDVFVDPLTKRYGRHGHSLDAADER